jgi:hypothetical protein
VLARLMIAATAIAQHKGGRWLRVPSIAPSKRNAIPTKTAPWKRGIIPPLHE